MVRSQHDRSRRRRRPPPQRRSARLRARAARRVLPEDTESIVAQAREAYERARPFPFARLPGELRNLVYEFLVAGQNAAAGPQVFHHHHHAAADDDDDGAAVALPGLARAGRALRAEYLAVFFRRRAFEVHVYCDLAAWRELHRVALVASFLGSLDGAVRAVPRAAVVLAQARHYGCVKDMGAPLRRLWAELHAPRPGDGPAALAHKAARAAAGPLLANLVLFVGAFPEAPIGGVAGTPAADNFWSATLSRAPVTGRLSLDGRGRAASPQYENDLFAKLAANAGKTAADIADSQGGTFQGWSYLNILRICSRFRFWHNRRGPKEFAHEKYHYGDSDDDDDDVIVYTN